MSNGPSPGFEHQGYSGLSSVGLASAAQHNRRQQQDILNSQQEAFPGMATSSNSTLNNVVHQSYGSQPTSMPLNSLGGKDHRQQHQHHHHLLQPLQHQQQQHSTTPSGGNGQQNPSTTATMTQESPLYCNSCQTLRHASFFQGERDPKYNICELCKNHEYQKHNYTMKRYEYTQQQQANQHFASNTQLHHNQHQQHQHQLSAQGLQPQHLHSSNSSMGLSNLAHQQHQQHQSSSAPPILVKHTSSPPAHSTSMELPPTTIIPDVNNSHHHNNSNNKSHLYSANALRSQSQLQSHLLQHPPMNLPLPLSQQQQPPVLSLPHHHPQEHSNHEDGDHQQHQQQQSPMPSRPVPPMYAVKQHNSPANLTQHLQHTSHHHAQQQQQQQNQHARQSNQNQQSMNVSPHVRMNSNGNGGGVDMNQISTKGNSPDSVMLNKNKRPPIPPKPTHRMEGNASNSAKSSHGVRTNTDIMTLTQFVMALQQQDSFDRMHYAIDISSLTDQLQPGPTSSTAEEQKLNAGFTQIGRKICEHVLEGTKFNFSMKDRRRSTKAPDTTSTLRYYCSQRADIVKPRKPDKNKQTDRTVTALGNSTSTPAPKALNRYDCLGALTIVIDLAKQTAYLTLNHKTSHPPFVSTNHHGIQGSSSSNQRSSSEPRKRKDKKPNTSKKKKKASDDDHQQQHDQNPQQSTQQPIIQHQVQQTQPQHAQQQQHLQQLQQNHHHQLHQNQQQVVHQGLQQQQQQQQNLQQQHHRSPQQLQHQQNHQQHGYIGMTMRGALPPPPITATQQNQQILQQHSNMQHHHLLPPPSGTLLPPPSTIALPVTPTSTSMNSQQTNSMNNGAMAVVTGVSPSTSNAATTMVPTPPLPTVSPSVLVQRQFDALRQRVLEFDHLLEQQQVLRNKRFLQVATDAFATAHEMLTACQAHDQQQQRLQQQQQQQHQHQQHHHHPHHPHHHLFGNGPTPSSSSSSSSSSSPSPSPSLPLTNSKYTIHYNKKGDGLE